MKKRYPFVVLEGTHGAGKTSVAKILAEEFGFYKIETPNSKYDQLREYMHHEASGLSRFLFYLASVVDVSYGLSELLEQRPVICDRYIYSTIAGCCVDYDLEFSYLNAILSTMENEIVYPDAVFFLRVHDDARLKRLSVRLENEPLYKCNDDIERARLIERFHITNNYDPNTWSILDTSTLSLNDVVSKIISSVFERFDFDCSVR